MRFLLFLLPSLCIAAGKGSPAAGLGAAPQAAPASSATIRGGGRSGQDLRNPPPLDPKRKVKEQDCSKPIDTTGGNLKCK